MNITKTITLLALAYTSGFGIAGENLLEKGDFPNQDIRPWKVFSLRSTKKAEVVIKDGVLTLTTDYATGKSTKRQLIQHLPEIKSETKYQLTFDAKASKKPAKLTITLSRSKDWEKGHYGFLKKMELETTWKSHTIYFTTKKIEPDNKPVFKILYGTVVGDVSFRNIKLIEATGNGKK